MIKYNNIQSRAKLPSTNELEQLLNSLKLQNPQTNRTETFSPEKLEDIKQTYHISHENHDAKEYESVIEDNFYNSRCYDSIIQHCLEFEKSKKEDIKSKHDQQPSLKKSSVERSIVRISCKQHLPTLSENKNVKKNDLDSRSHIKNTSRQHEKSQNDLESIKKVKKQLFKDNKENIRYNPTTLDFKPLIKRQPQFQSKKSVNLANHRIHKFSDCGQFLKVNKRK